VVNGILLDSYSAPISLLHKLGTDVSLSGPGARRESQESRSASIHGARLGDHRNSNDEVYHIRIRGIEHEAQMFDRVEVHLLKLLIASAIVFARASLTGICEHVLVANIAFVKGMGIWNAIEASGTAYGRRPRATMSLAPSQRFREPTASPWPITPTTAGPKTGRSDNENTSAVTLKERNTLYCFR
jgi:hypothetical protein